MMSRQASLLVVDDDEIDRELIQRGIRKAKIANPILTAENGIEALSILRDGGHQPGGPFIVILDWKMPRMNGLEFLIELRADPELRRTVVFVLTTSEDERDQYAAYDHLVAGYILKDNAGEEFTQLVDMLDSYWRIVELPHASYP